MSFRNLDDTTMNRTNKQMTLGRLGLIVGTLALGFANVGLGQQETTGSPARGETLFTLRYKCYACHGYDAQTGERRLKPMRYTQDGFIAFVQNSPLPQMPRYPDAASNDLADIYAYILSLPLDAPEVADVPLLKEILDAKNAALE